LLPVDTNGKKGVKSGSPAATLSLSQIQQNVSEVRRDGVAIPGWSFDRGTLTFSPGLGEHLIEILVQSVPNRIDKVGVFRGLGNWYLDANNNGQWDDGIDTHFSWGKQPGDIPLTGDWNGNHVTETGIFRPGGDWYLDMNNNGLWGRSHVWAQALSSSQNRRY
jgi:hypothetical protein